MVDHVAAGPLTLQINEARMSNQRLEAGCCALQPVDQVTAVARAGGGEPVGIDKGKATDGNINRLQNLFTGRA